MKTPKWAQRFIELVQKNWTFHGLSHNWCLSLSRSAELGCLKIGIAPVFQQKYGGEEDGKTVWSGFHFDVVELMREDGVWIQEICCFSRCESCGTSPNVKLIGKFEGHSFYLEIYLEPPSDSKIVEIVDTISKEVRNCDYENMEGEGIN